MLQDLQERHHNMIPVHHFRIQGVCQKLWESRCLSHLQRQRSLRCHWHLMVPLASDPSVPGGGKVLLVPSWQEHCLVPWDLAQAACLWVWSWCSELSSVTSGTVNSSYKTHTSCPVFEMLLWFSAPQVEGIWELSAGSCATLQICQPGLGICGLLGFREVLVKVLHIQGMRRLETGLIPHNNLLS